MASQPDWNKFSFFATLAIGIMTITIAAIAYLRPPDPAHPVRFDFLWTTVSVSLPLWLAGLTAIIVFSVVFYAGRAYQRKMHSPPRPETHRYIPPASRPVPLPRAPVTEVPVPAKDASAASTASNELVVTSPDDNIAIKIAPNEWQHLKGYVISIVNHRLGAISRVKLTVYRAQSFDQRHNDYRDGRDFTAFARIEPDPIDASQSGKTTWFVRKDRGEMLLVGDDSEHPLRWPDADKSSVQRWRLIVAIDAQTVPMNSSEAPTVLKQVKMSLILTWDKEHNRFAIAEETNDAGRKTESVPTVSAADPRLSILEVDTSQPQPESATQDKGRSRSLAPIDGHFWTTDAKGELLDKTSWKLEGPSCSVFAHQAQNTVPLWRWVSKITGASHLWTIDPNGELLDANAFKTRRRCMLRLSRPAARNLSFLSLPQRERWTFLDNGR